MSVQSTPMLSARELINRHVEWKLTLKYAIVARELLPQGIVDQILYPDRCPIGRWLISDCARAIRSSPEYLTVVRNHTDFHLHMTHIAEKIQASDFDGADRAIDPGSPFSASSQRLAMSITALDRLKRIEVAA